MNNRYFLIVFLFVQSNIWGLKDKPPATTVNPSEETPYVSREEYIAALNAVRARALSPIDESAE